MCKSKSPIPDLPKPDRPVWIEYLEDKVVIHCPGDVMTMSPEFSVPDGVEIIACSHYGLDKDP